MPSIYISSRYMAALSEAERSALKAAAERCDRSCVGAIIGPKDAGSTWPESWPVVGDLPPPVVGRNLVLVGAESKRDDVVSLQTGQRFSLRNRAFVKDINALICLFSMAPGGGLAMALDMADQKAVVEALMRRYQARLDRLEGLGKAYVFGARRLGKLVRDGLRARDCEVLNFLDNNKAAWGTEVDGCLISGVNTSLDPSVPVIIATTRFPYSIGEQLRGRGFEVVLPYPTMTLFDPEHFPPEIPYIEIHADIPANRGRYLAEYLNYVDDRSRQVLDRILLYRLTLDPLHVQSINDGERNQYFDPDLMPLSGMDVFVDAGGFDGMTSKAFIERAGGSYGHIFYFEPDEALMERSRKTLEGLGEITYCQAGAFSYDGNARFDTTGTTNGSVSADGEGGVEIKVRCIDKVVDRPPTIIKMDIEGAEPEALRGAAESIRRHAPRLAIAAYHKGADLWQLSHLIRSLNPNYEIGLRHYTESGLETVMYAVPSTRRGMSRRSRGEREG